ncbi:MAG: PAS domain-containing protein [Herminiimonas sp.]|nr:PAS domain-containing protein [Herminiimonas sp.]
MAEPWIALKWHDTIPGVVLEPVQVPGQELFCSPPRRSHNALRWPGAGSRSGPMQTTWVIVATGAAAAVLALALRLRKRPAPGFRIDINDLPNPLFVKDTDGRYVAVNDALIRMLGFTREQLIGFHTERSASAEETASHQALADRL